MADEIREIIDELNKGKEDLGEKRFSEYTEKLQSCLIKILQQKVKESPEMDIKYELDEIMKSCKKVDDFEEMKVNVLNIISLFSDFLVFNVCKDAAPVFLQECTQRYVVFTDFSFSKEYERFGFDTPEKMQRLSAAIRSVFYSQVASRISPSYAESQVKELFGFTDVLAGTYRSLYELNYDKITMNVILSQLQRQEQTD